MTACQDPKRLYQLWGVVEEQGGMQREETKERAAKPLVVKRALRSPKGGVKDTNSWRGPAVLAEKDWPTGMFMAR